MELSLLLASKLASMLLMVAVGFFVVRIGVMKAADSATISKLTVYVLTPCLIVHAFQIELTELRLKGFVASVAFFTASYLAWILVSTLLAKPLGLTRIDRCTLIFTNVGNLTLPIIGMVLGEEMTFYVGCLQLPFNLFMWTYGLLTIQGEHGGGVDFKKIFLNSNMVALYIGLAFLVTGLRLPDIIDTTMSSFSSMVGPASMLAAGMVLAGMDLKRIFTSVKAYFIQFGRLVIFPLIAIALLFASRIFTRFPELAPILMAVFVGLAAPSASTVAQLAIVYDDEPENANAYNVISLVLCVVTIPIMVGVYRFVFAKYL